MESIWTEPAVAEINIAELIFQDNLPRANTFKWIFASQYIIHNNTHTVNINLIIIRFISQYFRCYISWCATSLKEILSFTVIEVSQSKICQTRTLNIIKLSEYNIFRFDVPMHDTLGVQTWYGFYESKYESSSFFFWKKWWFLHMSIKIFANQ